MGAVVGLELIAGYLVAWGVRKARRAGERLDSDVDEVLDAGLDRLHDLVVTKLGDDPAVTRLEVEAAAGEVSERTRRRVADAVAEAAEWDVTFGGALEDLVGGLARLGAPATITASGLRSVAAGGNVDVRAEGGSVAGVSLGDVNLGGPAGPTGPGRAER